MPFNVPYNKVMNYISANNENYVSRLNYIGPPDEIRKMEAFNRWNCGMSVDINRILEYLQFCKSKPLRPTTIRSYRNVLVKCFCHTFSIMDEVEQKKLRATINYKFPIKVPPIEADLSKYFSLGETTEITEKLLEPYKTFFQMGIQSGLRRTELCNLKHSDFVKQEGEEVFFKTTRKGGSREEIRFSKDLYDHAQRIGVLDHPVYVISNPRTKKQFRGETLNTILKKRIKEILPDRKFHLHMMRHSFGTNLLKHGVPMPVVQKLLGHKSLKSTQHYMHFEAKDDGIQKYYTNVGKSLHLAEQRSYQVLDVETGCYVRKTKSALLLIFPKFRAMIDYIRSNIRHQEAA